MLGSLNQATVGGGLPPAARQVMLTASPSAYICFAGGWGSPRITGSPGGSDICFRYHKKILFSQIL